MLQLVAVMMVIALVGDAYQRSNVPLSTPPYGILYEFLRRGSASTWNLPEILAHPRGVLTKLDICRNFRQLLRLRCLP